MKKDSREEILGKIRLGLYGDPGHEKGGLSTRDAERDFNKEAEGPLSERIAKIDDILEQFIEELLKVNAAVMRAEKEEELKAVITNIVRSKAISSFAIWESDYLNTAGLKELLNSEGLEQIISCDKNEIAQAGIGITGADYAIADTGTIVLLADKDRPRSVSLLPPIHLAIVRRPDIVSNIRELFNILKQRLDAGEAPPNCMTFITGPSRTADIELNLTLGVHGPKELYVIII